MSGAAMLPVCNVLTSTSFELLGKILGKFKVKLKWQFYYIYVLMLIYTSI